MGMKKLHKHHIIPKHMGGSNDPSNITYLTPEEHGMAHWILFRLYGNLADRRAALGLFNMMGKEEILAEISQECGKRAGEWSTDNIKGSKWFYDPETLKERQCIPGEEPEGWLQGSPRTKGENNYFYNNPMSGEKNGMYGKSAVKGRKWYHNEEGESFYVLPDDALASYIPGRSPKHKQAMRDANK